MVGLGLTMEGINQNYVVYEFMLENGWQAMPRNVTVWSGTVLLLYLNKNYVNFPCFRLGLNVVSYERFKPSFDCSI